MMEHRPCPESGTAGVSRGYFFLSKRSCGGLGTGRLIPDRPLRAGGAVRQKQS